MNALPRLSATLLALAVSCASLAAQTPVKPPPWWRVNDDVTVSLFFDFNLPPPNSFTPSIEVVPSWYSPAITSGTPNNLTWLPTLTTHSGVLALVGNGTPKTGALEIKVDNDPHIDWIKIFWFQYDEFKGASGSLASSIRKDLGKYGRATVTEESRVAIGGGWETVTITAKLVPQPDDEKIDWSFFENAFGTEAIDNLFINSKCVKPGDDEKGEALGQIDAGGLSSAVDISAQTNILDCRAAAVTEGPAPTFTRTYWISANETTGFHKVFRLDQGGVALGSAFLPDAVATTPFGAGDMTVAPGSTPGSQVVYVLVDRRPANPVTLRAINTSTGLYDSSQDIQLPALAIPPGQVQGLTYDPSGNLGAGSFWISDQNGNVLEFSRAATAVQLDSRSIALPVVGAGFSGLGYDATFGNFYGFSNAPRPSPFGPLRVNGYEWSGHDFAPSGTEFLGNLNALPPGTTPRGGVATGLEVYRRGSDGAFRMVCVVRDPGIGGHSWLYELKGPYRFGWSQMGTCGMQGGPPFEGGSSFAVTLRGVPNTVAAFLYAGLSNSASTLGPLPAPLALLGPGFDESFLSVSLDVSLGGFTPTAPGRFVAPVLLPPAGGLSYVPIYFQWIVLDTTVPGLMAMSQAGKTIAY